MSPDKQTEPEYEREDDLAHAAVGRGHLPDNGVGLASDDAGRSRRIPLPPDAVKRVRIALHSIIQQPEVSCFLYSAYGVMIRSATEGTNNAGGHLLPSIDDTAG